MEHFREQLRRDFGGYPAEAVAPLDWFLPETHDRMRATGVDDTWDETELIHEPDARG